MRELPFPSSIINVSNNGLPTWDVTTLAQEWHINIIANNGLMLVLADETPKTETVRNFQSSELIFFVRPTPSRQVTYQP